MRRRLALLLIVLTPPLWTACASDAPQAGIEPIAAEIPGTEDTAEALRVFTEDKSRLKRVEYRVRVGGAEFCSSIVRPDGGILIGGASGSEDQTVNELAARAYARGELPTIVYVVPGSPLERAGVRSGDQIAALDGNEDRDVASMSRTVSESAGRPLRVTVSREGEALEFAAQLPLACDFSVVFSSRDSLLPWSEDEWTIVIPVGLMRATDDDELAIAVGHQLAHAMIALSAAPIDNPESEADVLGLYMTAAAGYDVSLAPAFWERLAAESPHLILPGEGEKGAVSHMDVADRLPRIERTASQLAR